MTAVASIDEAIVSPATSCFTEAVEDNIDASLMSADSFNAWLGDTTGDPSGSISIASDPDGSGGGAGGGEGGAGGMSSSGGPGSVTDGIDVESASCTSC